MDSILVVLVAGLVIGSWVVRVGTQLSDGYHNSNAVLDKREQLAVLACERDDLTNEVVHARTDEGRAEQVKIQFGAGPPDDVLLDVYFEAGAREEPPVVGLGEKTGASISVAIDACMRPVRRFHDVWKYWAGRDPLPPLANNESSDADQL